jgi:glutamate/tyrosine decarboxylase-like PLP-dependent enzyme
MPGRLLIEYQTYRGLIMKKYWIPILILAFSLVLFSPTGCSKQPVEEAGEETEEPAEEAAETAAKPAAPKMNDDVYVEIKARSALIYEKFKYDPDQAQKEIEALYEKKGVTFAEYKEFSAKLTFLQSNELERRVVDFMQKIAQEYR